MKRGQPLQRHTRLKPISKKLRNAKGERASVREQVFARDGYRCLLADGGPHWCRWDSCFGNLTVHHLRKAAQGGTYELEQLITLCAHHNDSQEDHPAASLACGLTVRGEVDHAEAGRRRASWHEAGDCAR